MRRHWPDALEVTLEEHKPLARWGDAALLNSYGEVFQAATAQLLPLLSGPAGSEKEVAQRYADFSRIAAAAASASGRSRPERAPLRGAIRLDNGMSIALGREQWMTRLVSFVALYPSTLANVATPVHLCGFALPQWFCGACAGRRRQAD